MNDIQKKLTRIFDIVLSVGQNFKWANRIQEIKPWVEGNENLDGLSWTIAAVHNCTHLDRR